MTTAEQEQDMERLRLLRQLIDGLQGNGLIGKDEGFVMMLFDLGDFGRLSYISTADREDVCATLLEFVDQQKPEVVRRVYERRDARRRLGRGAEVTN